MKRLCFCNAYDITLLLICPKEALLDVLKDFPDARSEMERMAEERKRKLKNKLRKITHEQHMKAKNDESPKQLKVLLKTTEYVNKMLLKLPDPSVRYEMKKKAEKKLRKSIPSLGLLDSPTKPKSFVNILMSPTLKKPMRKSLQDKTAKNSKDTAKLAVPLREDARGKKESAKDLKSLNEIDFSKEDQKKPKHDKLTRQPSSSFVKIVLSESKPRDCIVQVDERLPDNGSVSTYKLDQLNNSGRYSIITPRERTLWSKRGSDAIKETQQKTDRSTLENIEKVRIKTHNKISLTTFMSNLARKTIKLANAMIFPTKRKLSHIFLKAPNKIVPINTKSSSPFPS